MIIKLDDGKAYPILERVGDYIDSLVEDKRSQSVKLKSIADMAKSWLESDCNTANKAKEKVCLSLIFDLAHLEQENFTKIEEVPPKPQETKCP